MVDLLAFLNDDGFTVQDAGDVFVDDNKKTANDPEPEPDTSPDDDITNPPSPPDVDLDEENDLDDDSSTGSPEPDTTPVPSITPDEEENEKEGDEQGSDEDAQIDINQTFKFMKEMNLLDVADDFQFDGTPEKAEEAIDQTLKNLRKSAQRSLMETLSPEFKDILTYALANGQGANLNAYLKEIQATNVDDINSINIDDLENQKYVIRAYQKETTQHSDQKINRYISMLEDSGMLETEAKENLTDLMNIRQLRKAEKTKEYLKAIEDRDETKRNVRKKFEGIIDSADYIETPRKNKLKAFINNERQSKGSIPTTGFERAISQIMANQEHIVQLGDLVESLYDPENGFDYERLTKKKASAVASNIRRKLDKFLTHPDGGKAKPAGPATNSFNWEEYLNQI